MDFSTLPAASQGRVREWQHLSGVDFESMDRRRTVVLVTCSPLEVHGPHLPVIADNAEAEGLSAAMVEKLCERFDDITFVHLPPIYVASDVLPHHGSLAFRPSTIVRVLEDLGRTLSKQGFRHVWIGSFHGGPRHFLAMEEACARVNRRYGMQMVSVFSLMIARLTSGTANLEEVLGEVSGLGREALEGDNHGGAIETSILLHLLGPHVKPSFKELPRRSVDLDLESRGEPLLAHATLWERLRSFREMLLYYARTTYSGAPGLASPEAGERILDTLSTHAADALGELWLGTLDAKDCHSPLWKWRHLFLAPGVATAFERLIGFRNPIF
ncbi:MAG: creatininase family protein [Sandaracinus sp.]|nr:creatininase family protein [Sandaracinus sp.]MCB9621826.1 creatininase family protein [Sandaracinus sp.]